MAVFPLGIFMNKFMNENFLLKSELAQKLFQKSSNMPIIDYHCHLSPKEIYEDKTFDNITQIWLYGDHYKWRLMRAAGIDEEYITGKASDLDKFKAYAKTLELCIGNPVYTFSHLELQRFFDIYEPLSAKNAEDIYERCNTIIKERQYSPKKLIALSNVETLCTTDDPSDSLEYHKLIKADASFKTNVYPAFRPDKAKDINNHAYYLYIDSLSKASNMEINSFDSLIEALHSRMKYFNSLGCRTSDHALITVPYVPATVAELDEIFDKALSNLELSAKEISAFETAFMLKMAELDNEFDWVMQLHFGCIRNNNSRMFKLLGPDTGYDAINETGVGSLGKLLNALDSENKLPKTVLYSLNPNENAQIVTMMGCFNDGKTRGKIQLGSAWWFNDHRDGIISQLRSLANDGVLGNFIGMLTDSRSFLSYPRHEYFRRIVSNLIAEYVLDGEYPDDDDLLTAIIENISYNNVKEYFKF